MALQFIGANFIDRIANIRQVDFVGQFDFHSRMRVRGIETTPLEAEFSQRKLADVILIFFLSAAHRRTNLLAVLRQSMKERIATFDTKAIEAFQSLSTHD